SLFRSMQPVPGEYRSSFLHLYLDLTWYNLVLNAGLLSGSLLGPVLAGALGLPQTLAVSAALRFLMAVGILLWA
ncbi:MAG: hypothetical protein M8467_07150, partial [Anaerolineae bacterium]|nr:hypothetical protein [Anaerolineae bacterium]